MVREAPESSVADLSDICRYLEQYLTASMLREELCECTRAAGLAILVCITDSIDYDLTIARQWLCAKSDHERSWAPLLEFILSPRERNTLKRILLQMLNVSLE